MKLDQKITILFALLHISLLSLIKFFPYPELFVYPYLAENGLLPYRQILDQHLPSLLMSPFNLYDLGLRTETSAKIFLLVSVLLTHLFIFLISKKLFKNTKFSFGPNIIYLLIQPLFEGNYLWLDTFLAPILLIAYYFCLRLIDSKKIIYPILAGLFLGLAMYFKQVMFPLVFFIVFAVFWITRSKQKLFYLVLSSLMPFLLLMIWVYDNQIWNEFVYWTFTFNFEVYSKLGRQLPSLSPFVRYVLIWSPAFLWLAHSRKEKKYFLLLIFTVFSLFTAVTRFEFVHLQPSLVFAVLALFGLINSKLGLKYVFFTLITVLLFVWWPNFVRNNYQKPSSLFTRDISEVSYLVSLMTNENEKIFVLGTQPLVYPLSDRLPSGNLFTVNVPWNIKVSQDKIYEALIEDPPSVVIRDQTATIDEKKVVDFSPKLNAYINDNYVLVKKIGTNEVLVNNENLY